MHVRPLSFVPKPVLFALALGVCAQLSWHVSHPQEQPSAARLSGPPTLAAAQLTSLGESIALSKLLLLYMQSFDDQPGVIAPFRQLDFKRVQHWLELALKLDPRGQYPLFLASSVYGEVGDPDKQRVMFNFVYREFFADPNQRWPALANAASMTRHRLGDLPTAQKYTQAIREQATGSNVPDWAKQMDIFMLADMQQYDQALKLLDQLIQSGQISDANELIFLKERRDGIVADMRAKENR